MSSSVRVVTNSEIADRLVELSALLDLAEANPYAVRAYRRAAEVVRATPAPVAQLVRQGRVRELRGIGPSIAARLEELVRTGEIAELRELSADVRPELVALGRLAGVGTKRMLEIGRALDVTTAEEFRAAAENGELGRVAGIGPATEAKILAGLAREPRPQRGLTINRARALLGSIAETLGGVIAGDPRRYCELSFELAVAVPAHNPAPVLDAFEAHPSVIVVVERGERRAVGVTVEGVPVRLAVAEPARFGTELLRATGPPAYVASLQPLPDRPDEESVYAALGLPWLPPELRDHPPDGDPPRLVELADVRGELHCHTTWSDGRASVLEMGQAAKALGYEYLAICDHTPNVRVVPGLTADDLRRQGEEIAEGKRAAGAVPPPAGSRVRHPCRRLARRRRRNARRARMGATEPPRGPAARQGRPDAHGLGGACATHTCRRSVTRRAACSIAGPRTRSTSTRSSRSPSRPVSRSRSTASPTDSTSPASTSARHSPPVSPSSLNSDAHSTAGLTNMDLAVATARRGGCAACEHRQHALLPSSYRRLRGVLEPRDPIEAVQRPRKDISASPNLSQVPPLRRRRRPADRRRRRPRRLRDLRQQQDGRQDRLVADGILVELHELEQLAQHRADLQADLAERGRDHRDHGRRGQRVRLRRRHLAGAGLRLRLRQPGPHRHRPARRRRRLVHVRPLLERRQVQGDSRGRGRLQRPGRDQGERARVAAAPARARRLRQGPGRRRRGRDRQPVRPRGDDHLRHRQRPPPRHHLSEQLHHHRHDPDRRRHQPRQLRRRPPRTPPATSSASRLRSTASRAATTASASRFPPTRCARSSRS